MPRTPVPPPSPNRPNAAGADGDRIPEKIAKYVPAETLAFFVPVAALLGTNHKGLLVIAALVGAAGTPGYLYLQAKRLPAAERPLWHFYVLSVIGFFCWALGTTAALADLIGLDEKAAGVVLLIAVFALPLVDSLANTLQGRSNVATIAPTVGSPT